MSTNTQKLRKLRARTDFDLVVLVKRELDKGLSAVALATTRNSSLFAQAVKAHKAAGLLPRIAGLNVDDRLRMESKLEALRSRLDTVPTYANVPSYYPASFAS
jgi:hypothetical protein